MEAKLQLRVQRYGWDRAAPYYDAAWREALAPATEALLSRADLRTGEHVLDVACGSGVLTMAALRAVGSSGNVTATDLSEQMLETTAENMRIAGLTGVQFVRADAQALDDVLPSASFDVVLCGLGLMYMPDPEQAMAAMARRLRPGGRLVVSVWGDRRDCGWAGLFPIVDARVQSEVCPLFFRLGAGDVLEKALREAGLGDVISTRLQTTLTFAGARTACDAAFLGGPVALAYSRFDKPTREAVQAEYLGLIARWCGADGIHMPGSFVVACGQSVAPGLRPGLRDHLPGVQASSPVRLTAAGFAPQEFLVSSETSRNAAGNSRLSTPLKEKES